MDPAVSFWSKTVKYAKLHSANVLIALLRALPGTCRRNMSDLIQSLEFACWVAGRFGRGASFVPTRDRLWKRMIGTLDKDARVTVYEFGVAYGHVTRWWLSHCGFIGNWYGFDVFTGLPKPWRHFKAGAFSAGGNPPEIQDSRIEWIVGKVEETVSPAIIRKSADGRDRTQRVFILDLDLYEPTRHVLEQLFPLLKEGDVLYLDEAAYWDERAALLEMMNRVPVPLELIGATPVAIALRVAKIRTEGT